MDALISDQTIEFDIHRAGDGQAAGLKGLHMHKRMNGKRKGVDVLIPLDGGQDLIFRPPSTSDDVKSRLINEIRKALSKDPQKRQELVKAVVGAIERFSSGEGQLTDQVNNSAREGARSIARVFSKNDRIFQEMEQMINKRLGFLITSHEKENGESFYIKQDFARKRVKISDDLEELNYGNESRKWPD